MLGHPELITPYNTTQFHAMSERLRKHHRAMAAQDRAIVKELRPGLESIKGNRIALGADSKVNAYRVCRNLVFASSLNMELAGTYVKLYDLYHELFVNRRGGATRPKFDPDK